MVSHVEYPGRRFEMIKSIEELADFEMQKREWVKSDHPCWFWAKAFYAIDMLLNETSIDELGEDAVGYRLRNVDEIKAVNKLGKLLMQVEESKPDSYYLTSPLWQEVVAAAKEAHEILMKDEDLDELLRQENARDVK